jgi:ABC-2 type transport system ATP-binding protein
MSTNEVIEVRGLTRKFKNITALNKVDLTVRQGRVFGIVGSNGAGKTTLMKHLLGLYKPQEGSVRVFGLDPVKDPVSVLGRIGYLSEDRDLPDWMTVRELILYTQAFYPGWDEKYAEELRETFGLDPAAKIKTLSRGQKAQAGLLIAIAYRPPLLLLDEPSSGLDPVVRRDILGAIIRAVAEEGRTVVFSSHLLDEVERVADEVAMIHDGKVAACAELDTLKNGFTRITIRFAEPRSTLPTIEGVLAHEGNGREWTLTCNGAKEAVHAAIQSAGATVVEESTPSLEDIFVARMGANRKAFKES